MKEIREGLMRCLEENKRVVVATIVQVQGSAYRREGARCLIYESGEVIGILSGGCVEADLVEHAKGVFETNTAVKIEYDFRQLNDEVWGLGLGCNGSIAVWLQPFDPVKHRAEAEGLLLEFQYRTVTEQPYFFTAVIESAEPSVVRPGSYWRLTEPRLNSQDPIEKTNGLQDYQIDGVQVTLFVEQVAPPPRLAIIGSGPDAALLARRASALEWRVSVIDHREAFLNTYFADVERVLISKGDYKSVSISPGSFVVIMTHNLDLDRSAVAALLPQDIPYVGILGSRQRIVHILNHLTSSSAPLDPEQLGKLHSPIGLDIGAESPEEITLSILSELLAMRRGRTGGSLSNVKEFIPQHAIR